MSSNTTSQTQLSQVRNRVHRIFRGGGGGGGGGVTCIGYIHTSCWGSEYMPPRNSPGVNSGKFSSQGLPDLYYVSCRCGAEAVIQSHTDHPKCLPEVQGKFYY